MDKEKIKRNMSENQKENWTEKKDHVFMYIFVCTYNM